VRANKNKKQSLWLGAVMWLLLLSGCLPVNRSPYQNKKYYRQTKAAIDRLPAPVYSPDTVRVGWAKVNITPTAKAPLAGYGKRKGKNLTSIHDSIYVRAFVFKNKTRKVAFVSLDLLIVPMSVTAALEKALPRIGFARNQTYLTATHAHSSLGGWAKKPAGYLMAGKYSPAIVEHLTTAILKAIKEAEAAAAPAQLGFAAVPADLFVSNRLLGASATRDTLLRLVKIRKRTGEKALLFTYAAHATCLPASELTLSGDYPAALVQALEKKEVVSFAAFAAGGVASHSPAAVGSGYEKVNHMVKGLSLIIQKHINQIPLAYAFKLQALTVPLYLRKPHWRIAQNWRLPPALFYLVFGNYPATLSALRLGNILFLGTPCDFSGELALELQRQIPAGAENLLVTSFNGGYIGYITPDKYYNLKKYETRDMNLFGPYNGAYLSEMMQLLLQKL